MSATVLTGDCLDVMATLALSSADAIVTDPPYGLGFMGECWDHGVPGPHYWSAALRVAKPGAYLLAFGGTRTYHRLTCAIEDAGWEIRDCLSYLYGSGFPKSHNGPWGGTALKPAWEPIILARKSLIGTVAANVTAHGTGALNIDATRVVGPKGTGVWGSSNKSVAPDRKFNASPNGEDYRSSAHDAGRWPANVCLDEEAAAMLDEQSGTLTSGANPTRRGSNKFAHTYGDFVGQEACTPARGVDVGGASRFFYTSKASRSERNAGLDGMPRKRVGVMQDDAYEWKGTADHAAHKTPPAPNHHPTVKPLDLMQWLCRLVTPPGGLILDPFCGSGSTGCAAMLEGFRFLGMDLSEEYCAIARARIAHAAASRTLDLFAGTDG